MKLSERMKHWPALTVHRVAEIEAALVSMEERLTALEPKKAEVKEVKPAPFVPVSSFEPIPAPPAPIPEPSVLPSPTPTLMPTPFEPVRLGPTPSYNPLDGTNLKS
jgi:hypothetical protein